MRYLGLVTILCACGGSQQAPKPAPAPPKPVAPPTSWPRPAAAGGERRAVDQWTDADEEHHIDLACRNMVDTRGAFRCELLEKAGLEPNQCKESFRDFFTTAADNRERFASRLLVAGLADADSCEVVYATFKVAAAYIRGETITPGPSTAPVVSDGRMTCKQRDDGAYDLTTEDVLARRGLGDRRFDATASTREAPIEVCGLRGELEYLLRVTCADGSRPWGRDRDQAHRARSGSQRAKGRCGDPSFPILDHYVAKCPERTYDIYIDMYECGPGEQLFE